MIIRDGRMIGHGNRDMGPAPKLPDQPAALQRSPLGPPELPSVQIYATLKGEVAVRNGPLEFTITPEVADEMQKIVGTAAAKARGIRALLPKLPKDLTPEQQKKWFEEKLGP